MSPDLIMYAKMLFMILMVNIVLSADNAIVIAMATKNLEGKIKKQAIFWGTAGAIVLRIAFVFFVVLLLKIPFIMIVGGLLLFYVAVKLLVHEDNQDNVKAGSNLKESIKTIIVADAAMSLDNVLALTAQAKGNFYIIIIGILISIPIIVFFSNVVSKLMTKFPILIYVGSGILGWTAGEMLIEDKHIHKFVENISIPHAEQIILALCVILVLAVGYLWNKTNMKQKVA